MPWEVMYTELPDITRGLMDPALQTATVIIQCLLMSIMNQYNSISAADRCVIALPDHLTFPTHCNSILFLSTCNGYTDCKHTLPSSWQPVTGSTALRSHRPIDHAMKRRQQQETDFFQRKSKCIENRDDSASNVNISDSKYNYFCSEDKGTVLITDCKPDPASTSSNNSKSDAVSIRDRESTSLCTEDTGAVLLSQKLTQPSLLLDFPTGKMLPRNFHITKIVNLTKVPKKLSIKSQFQLGYLPKLARKWKKAQKSLITIVSSIEFLATRGIALRGKQEKEGNLYELLELRGNEIPDIKDWLSKQHNWLSHDIQNEILQLLSLTVERNLNQDIRKNKCHALIVDEATDHSTEEQVSISLQHVNDNFDTSSTTEDTYVAIIEDVLLSLDLPIEDCQGAQAVISSKEIRAIYIHCFSHFLNLARIHASSTIPEISNVLENVHTLVNFFNESAKITVIFLNYKADDDSALAKNTSLKPLCLTRWTVRSKSLNVVNSQYETTLSVLDSLKSKESVANGLSAFFEKTSSLFYLEVPVVDIEGEF
ncbi:hypothetical protein PR048_017395 [Dryococelus australis]|uniref:DUF4371 domain-containing protein n=1 Tax=Dryococelus australis TaxID=614101 RepID=A0ABQ9H9E0_9NEOP|nr:hypothetical protein PR048_017395 [Dryococelus australis]